MFKLYRKQILFPFISFLIPFILYILTLSPSINFGDTGELVAAAHTLGIPHPPGSPVWVILAKIFTFLPFGNIAYRVNLASAAFAALSAPLLFLISRKLLHRFLVSLSEHTQNVSHLSRKQMKKQKDMIASAKLENFERIEDLKKYVDFIALSMALTFAVLLPVWTFAVVTEVYTLNLLFTAIILYCILLYLEQNNEKYLYISAFVFGLGITNHYLILFLGLAILAWVLIHERRLLTNPKIVGISALCIFAGLLVFLYLPIRSAANPIIDWGNPETVENMIAVIARKQFTGGKVEASPILAPSDQNPDMIFRLFQAVSSTVQGIIKSYSILSVVVVLGLYASLRYLRRFFAPFLYTFFFYTTILAYVINYVISLNDRTSTFIAGYFSLSIAASLGIMYGLYLVSGFFKSIATHSRTLIVTSAVLFIPLVYALINYPVADMSKNNIAHLHAQKILELLPPDTILFTEENNWIFPLLYLHSVEQMRPDITIYDRNGNLYENIYEEALQAKRSEDDYERMRRQIELNLAKQTGKPAYYAVDKSFENYGYQDLMPVGILYSQGTHENFDFGTYYSEILSLDPKDYSKYYGSEYMIAYYHLQYAEELRRNKNIDDALRQYDLAAAWGKNESIILNNLGVIYNQMGESARAKNVLLQALKINDQNIRANKNLGVIYAQEGNYEEAETYFKKALKINDRNVEAIISLSLLYEQTGRTQEALQGYQFALSLDPQNPEIQKKIQELTR